MNDLTLRFHFLKEIEKLKTVTRGNRTLDDRFENSAEHSWHVALMAVLLEDYSSESLDILKVVKMLLIHDIVEIDAGDTWLYSEDQADKQIVENEAADRIFNMLPDSVAIEYRMLWDEFEARVTDEAKYAAVIDAIQPLLNHVLTGSPETGVIPVKQVMSRKAFIKDFAPALWGHVASLIEESVEKGFYA
ncbi:MAG: HD domain-containing protein [Endozoicomonas sp.]|uniref:HD domain-containing protein n=1 Tax=Endozoicomonas sp. TaxID=1892382 RepID=UPI003D9ABB38